MKKPPQITERIIPPKYKHVIDSEFLLRLTLKERLLLIFGCNLQLAHRLTVEHLPGKHHPTLMHKVVNKF
jgi:hypothetical protein